MHPGSQDWWTVTHNSWLWTETHNFAKVRALVRLQRAPKLTVIAALSQKTDISCMHYKQNLIFDPCVFSIQLGTNTFLQL